MATRGDWQLVPDAASGGYWWNSKTNEVAWTAPQDAEAPEDPTSPTPAAVPDPAATAPVAPDAPDASPAAAEPAAPAEPAEPAAPAAPAAPTAPTATAPAPAAAAGTWQLVPDAASGCSYWWNASTNEVVAVRAGGSLLSFSAT